MRAGFPACLVAVVLLGGCASYDSLQPPVESPMAFSQSGQVPSLSKWWEGLGDPQLPSLIEQALQDNLDLKGTLERVKQAHYSAQKSRSALYPTLDASAKAGGESVVKGEGSDQESYQIGLDADYELDWWGRLADTARASKLEQRVSEENYRQAALELAVAISNAWYGLKESVQLQALLNEQYRIATQVLEAVEYRYSTGKTDYSDILQQRRQVKSLEAEQIQAAADRRSYELELSVLLGHAPGEGFLPESGLGDVPALPLIGIPSELLQRRPDVAVAYYTLEADNATAAAAVKAQYPQLNFSASLTSSASSFSDLLDRWLFSIFGNLVAPLVDFGQKELTAKQTMSQADESAYRYAQTILEAYQEVEEALLKEGTQRQKEQNLAEQVALTKEAFENILERYSKGSGSYLDALNALATWQELERQLLSSRAQLWTYRIALHQALGSDWKPKLPEWDAKTNE